MSFVLPVRSNAGFDPTKGRGKAQTVLAAKPFPVALAGAEPGCVETRDTLDFLLGTRDLDRSIEDHLSRLR